VRNDSATKGISRVLVGVGDDFESANAAVMYHARDVVASAQASSGEQAKELDALKEGDETTKLWAENWYDGLTYCRLLLLYLQNVAHQIHRYLECTWTKAY